MQPNSHIDAGRAGQNPAIVFMTTAEISNISSKTVNLATSLGVGVFHSIACELNNRPGFLRMGDTFLTNPQAYGNVIPTDAGGPGAIDTLRFS